jgi:hypothetical protein
MKTLKLALVATLVAFAMVSMANSDGFKSKPRIGMAVSLTIEKAMQNPGLVAAMHNQISPEILHFPMPPITAEVKYNGNLYRISGTRTEWLRFFRIRGIFPLETIVKSAGTD